MKKRFIPGNYFQVSNYTFQFVLKPSSFVLYCYLKMRERPEKGCFPTKEKICSDTGLSRSNVDNGLKELQEKDLVFVDYQYQGSHQTSNLYRLRDVQQAWMGRYFISKALEEELKKEKESERMVQELLNEDEF